MYGPEQVDSSLCTHIIYAWAHLDADSSEIIPGNTELDIENGKIRQNYPTNLLCYFRTYVAGKSDTWGIDSIVILYYIATRYCKLLNGAFCLSDFYGKITEYRLKGVKVIIGVGGLEDSEGDKWSIMAADRDKRKTFVKSVVKFLNRWNFDGLQLAWQYPVCKQVAKWRYKFILPNLHYVFWFTFTQWSRSIKVLDTYILPDDSYKLFFWQAPCNNIDDSERSSFNVLIIELSKALRPLSMELSALVASSPEIASVAYNPEILASSVDWIAIAANDYYGSSSGRTSYLVALETDHTSELGSFVSSLPVLNSFSQMFFFAALLWCFDVLFCTFLSQLDPFFNLGCMYRTKSIQLQ